MPNTWFCEAHQDRGPLNSTPTSKKQSPDFAAGCIGALVLGVVLLVGLGGCVALVAYGTSRTTTTLETATADTAFDGGSDNPSGVDRGFASKDASADLVDVSLAPPDAIGVSYVSVTVTNHSEEPSNYLIELSFESADGSLKVGDAAVYIRNLGPGQTTTERSIASISSTGSADKYRVTMLQRTAS